MNKQIVFINVSWNDAHKKVFSIASLTFLGQFAANRAPSPAHPLEGNSYFICVLILKLNPATRLQYKN